MDGRRILLAIEINKANIKRGEKSIEIMFEDENEASKMSIFISEKHKEYAAEDKVAIGRYLDLCELHNT